MHRILYLTLFLLPLSASFMQKRWEKAQVGDYLVLSSGKMITLLSIHAIEETSLFLEEIAIPRKETQELPWPLWVQKRAPGHSSWSMVEIDRTTGDILNAYSFTQSAWLDLSSQHHWASALLQLPWHPVPKEHLRRIGPAPLEGEPDRRKIWAPSPCFDGKKADLSFIALSSTWPQDNSELSDKQIILYFDQEIDFPFPFWIQAETSPVSLSFRAIDAGRGLISPKKKFPHRQKKQK
ncbi:MAG: hypothetical protein KGI80_01205 [Verrucomicrobiota bacterium]|nr:hypothetical protein [Verrucomicrobiota bacterium]